MISYLKLIKKKVHYKRNPERLKKNIEFTSQIYNNLKAVKMCNKRHKTIILAHVNYWILLVSQNLFLLIDSIAQYKVHTMNLAVRCS